MNNTTAKKNDKQSAHNKNVTESSTSQETSEIRFPSKQSLQTCRMKILKTPHIRKSKIHTQKVFIYQDLPRGRELMT